LDSADIPNERFLSLTGVIMKIEVLEAFLKELLINKEG